MNKESVHLLKRNSEFQGRFGSVTRKQSVSPDEIILHLLVETHRYPVFQPELPRVFGYQIVDSPFSQAEVPT
jgi:hypothetical protein